MRHAHTERERERDTQRERERGNTHTHTHAHKNRRMILQHSMSTCIGKKAEVSKQRVDEQANIPSPVKPNWSVRHNQWLKTISRPHNLAHRDTHT